MIIKLRILLKMPTAGATPVILIVSLSEGLAPAMIPVWVDVGPQWTTLRNNKIRGRHKKPLRRRLGSAIGEKQRVCWKPQGGPWMTVMCGQLAMWSRGLRAQVGDTRSSIRGGFLGISLPSSSEARDKLEEASTEQGSTSPGLPFIFSHF